VLRDRKIAAQRDRKRSISRRSGNDGKRAARRSIDDFVDGKVGAGVSEDSGARRNDSPNEVDSRPLAGIRSFSEVLRHVAFWNQYVADTMNGKKADDAGNELPLARYSTKQSVLEAFRRSSADVASALCEHRGSLDLKATELIMEFAEHTSEHYGQLVVYTRLMGITPPASRA
jgi:hypothetical protein